MVSSRRDEKNNSETGCRRNFRVLVCIIVWFNLLTTYMCRINLSVGIIGFINYMKEVKKVEITQEMQNYLLLSFNIGYLLLHIPGAILCIIFGSRLIMLCSLFFTSLFTFLCVPAARMNFWLLFGMRTAVGAAGATIISLVQQCVANYALPKERTFYSLAIFTGNIGSLIIIFPLGGVLVQDYKNGWEWMFYITGGLCALAFVLSFIFSFEDPESNPWMSRNEQIMIADAIFPEGKPQKKTLRNYPFKAILTSPATYVFMFAHFGKLLIFYRNLFGLVTYFRGYFGMSVKESSNYSVIPFALDFLFHFVYHHIVELMKRGGLSMTSIRRINTFIGSLGCSCFLFGLAFVPPERKLLGIILSSLGMILIPAFQAGYFPAIIEYAPQYSLMTMSIINVAGSFAGIMQRYMTGTLLTRFGVELGYKYSFMLTSILSFVSSSVYVIFGTAERQKWSLASSTDKIF